MSLQKSLPWVSNILFSKNAIAENLSLQHVPGVASIDIPVEALNSTSSKQLFVDVMMSLFGVELVCNFGIELHEVDETCVVAALENTERNGTSVEMDETSEDMLHGVNTQTVTPAVENSTCGASSLHIKVEAFPSTVTEAGTRIEHNGVEMTSRSTSEKVKQMHEIAEDLNNGCANEVINTMSTGEESGVYSSLAESKAKQDFDHTPSRSPTWDIAQLQNASPTALSSARYALSEIDSPDEGICSFSYQGHNQITSKEAFLEDKKTASAINSARAGRESDGTDALPSYHAETISNPLHEFKPSHGEFQKPCDSVRNLNTTLYNNVHEILSKNGQANKLSFLYSQPLELVICSDFGNTLLLEKLIDFPAPKNITLPFRCQLRRDAEVVAELHTSLDKKCPRNKNNHQVVSVFCEVVVSKSGYVCCLPRSIEAPEMASSIYSKLLLEAKEYAEAVNILTTELTLKVTITGPEFPCMDVVMFPPLVSYYQTREERQVESLVEHQIKTAKSRSIYILEVEDSKRLDAPLFSRLFLSETSCVSIFINISFS